MGDRFFGSVDGERGVECGEGEGGPVEVARGDANSAGFFADGCCLASATEFLLHFFGGRLDGRGDLIDGPCFVEPVANILGRVLRGQGFRGEGLPGSLWVAGAVDAEGESPWVLFRSSGKDGTDESEVLARDARARAADA